MLQSGIILVGLTLASVWELAQGSSGMPMAVCKMDKLGGEVKLHFTDRTETATMFMGSIGNLTQGKHGFHVHQEGKLGNNCLDAGGHYNPGNMAHGDINSQTRHEGDFGNIIADASGVAKISITRNGTDLNKLINRSIVIHEKEDDLGVGNAPDSNTTGAAGARLDCCIIRWESSNSAMVSMTLVTLLLPALLLIVS